MSRTFSLNISIIFEHFVKFNFHRYFHKVPNVHLFEVYCWFGFGITSIYSLFLTISNLISTEKKKYLDNPRICYLPTPEQIVTMTYVYNKYFGSRFHRQCRLLHLQNFGTWHCNKLSAIRHREESVCIKKKQFKSVAKALKSNEVRPPLGAA